MPWAVKTIVWNDLGTPGEVVRAINDGIPFVVVVSGPLAQAFVHALGEARVGFAPETVRMLITVVAISQLLVLCFCTCERLQSQWQGTDARWNSVRDFV